MRSTLKVIVPRQLSIHLLALCWVRSLIENWHQLGVRAQMNSQELRYNLFVLPPLQETDSLIWQTCGWHQPPSIWSVRIHRLLFPPEGAGFVRKGEGDCLRVIAGTVPPYSRTLASHGCAVPQSVRY